MFSTYLFVMAGLIILAFVIAKVTDTSPETKVSKEVILNSLDLQKEFNAGALLLKIGPILAGLGLFGYLADLSQNNVGLRTILIGILLFVSAGIGIYLKTKSGKEEKWSIFSEALLLIASFASAGFLVTLNTFVSQEYNVNFLANGEFMAIWFLILLGLAYVGKSVWILSISVALSVYSTLVNLGTTLIPSNLIAGDLFRSDLSAVLALGITSIVSIAIYAWHHTKGHNDATKKYRTFMYLTGLMAFFQVGTLIYLSIDRYFEAFNSANADSTTALISNLIAAGVTLVLFGFDYIFKKTYKQYSISMLALVGVTLATIIGIFGSVSGNPFIAFYFLEAAFLVWILADWVRENSQISQILFYGLNSVQLYAIATSDGVYDWFKLVVIIAIIMYAAVVHYMYRGLVFYTLIAGVLALIIKLFNVTNIDGYLILLALGTILMAFGFFFTQTRSELLKNKKVEEVETKN